MFVNVVLYMCKFLKNNCHVINISRVDIILRFKAPCFFLFSITSIIFLEKHLTFWPGLPFGLCYIEVNTDDVLHILRGEGFYSCKNHSAGVQSTSLERNSGSSFKERHLFCEYWHLCQPSIVNFLFMWSLWSQKHWFLYIKHGNLCQFIQPHYSTMS